MANLTELKLEIQFNIRLGGLLEAIKAIAAQQFQSLERTTRQNPAFFSTIESIAAVFPFESISHPFTRPSGPRGVVAVTSDSGLLGGLNQQVVLLAAQEFRQDPGEFIVVGERGGSYAREFGLTYKSFPGVQDTNRHALAGQVREYLLNRVLAGHLAAVTIVYPRALSFSVQRIEIARALPCMEWFRDRAGERLSMGEHVVLESSVNQLLEYLVWTWMGHKLNEVFSMSRLAEMAARAVHLEGSSQELQRRRRALWLKYFRQRHEVIDRNLRELFGARVPSVEEVVPEDEELLALMEPPAGGKGLDG